VIKLIVGLGNPGQKYAKNRHNAGFLLLDKLIKIESGEFSLQSRFLGDLAEVITSANKLYLLKPNTFMNRSGQSVSLVMKYFKILPEEVLVVHDELDFSVGMMKLKFSGGHGGHNGLRDIISAMGTKDFVRLRLGIDRPRESEMVADYVLSDFSKLEAQKIDDMLAEIIKKVLALCTEGYQGVMRDINSRKSY
jgi:PTH1 family peptidyl-tRNA hydrolase